MCRLWRFVQFCGKGLVESRFGGLDIMNVHPVADPDARPGITDHLSILHDRGSLVDARDRNLVPRRYCRAGPHLLFAELQIDTFGKVFFCDRDVVSRMQAKETV